MFNTAQLVLSNAYLHQLHKAPLAAILYKERQPMDSFVWAKGEEICN
ncbi:hypothetical protein NUACC26_095000 [Scytonema sp. NUACC26]